MKKKIEGLLVVLALSCLGVTAQAVEIAYEGFGYDSGYLSISDPALDGVSTGLDDGSGSVVDAAIDSQLGDPARAGGTGAWVNGWTKRNPTGRSQAVSGDSTLSYSDSSGNALATTLGRARFPQSFTVMFRSFDASTIDPALTLPNDGSGNQNGTDPSTRPSFSAPTLGKQGTVVWFSMLADFKDIGNTHGNPAVAIQFQNKRDGTSFDGEPQSITGGITITRDGIAPYDVAAGKERLVAPGANFNFLANPPLDPSKAGVEPNLAGTAGAETAGTTFIVAKFDYNATFDFFGTPMTDGWADVTYWINPDLDSVPAAADAVLSETAYYPINGLAMLGRGNAGSLADSSSLDEIRFGTTFADVSPIAIPEPASVLLLGMAGVFCGMRRRQR